MEKNNIRTAYTYDDIQLIPKYSDIKSRKTINLSTLISKRYGLLIPFVAAPMDTVCGLEMAWRMYKLGSAGVIHRFNTIEQQSKIINELHNRIYKIKENEFLFEQWGFMYDDWHSEIKVPPIIAAIGVSADDKIRAKKLVNNGANILLIDVAHGHHKNVIEMIHWCKSNLPSNIDIIAGNIATADAAIELQDEGADGLRCGIGGGSLCVTRITTGFGVPNITSLNDVISVAIVPVIADGGVRMGGDAAKALAIGSSSVMIGSLLAGTDEAPGDIIETPKGLYKRYRGSASLDTKISNGQEGRNVEGVSTVIPYKGGAKFIINNLLDGVRSALSYGGARNLKQFHPEYNIVTSAGTAEASPHLIK